MAVTIKTYDAFRVEYRDRDGLWKGRRFAGPNAFAKAKACYDSRGEADLLGHVKYSGFDLLERK